MEVVQIKTDHGVVKGIGMKRKDGELAFLSGVQVGKEKVPLEENPILFNPKTVMKYEEMQHLYQDEYKSYKTLSKLDKLEILVAFNFMGGGSRMLFGRFFRDELLADFSESIQRFAVKIDLEIPEVLAFRDALDSGLLQESMNGMMLTEQQRILSFESETDIFELKTLLRLAAEMALKMEAKEKEMILQSLLQKLS